MGGECSPELWLRSSTPSLALSWPFWLAEDLGNFSGNRCAEIAMGGADPLAKEQEAGASGNLLGAGVEAQADCCGKVILGRGRRDQILWRCLSSTTWGWVLMLPCSLSNLFSWWLVSSREGPCTGQCHTTDARQAYSRCPCISLRIKGIAVDTTCHLGFVVTPWDKIPCFASVSS